MPIYDYRCDACGHAFSAVQSFSEAPVAACPNCGKPPRRLITAPAIVFKGSGWYKTDSRAAPKSEANGSSSSDTKTDTKSTGASDTKSATKSEAKQSEAKSDTKPSSTKSEGSS